MGENDFKLILKYVKNPLFFHIDYGELSLK